ncbi:MAG: hypothetical protein JWP34_693, partial [Massilia sp.]|nr:hypothetical protein [Massilia sp.]
MRRLLIIVLLLIFPFQVTLAAVDACCGYSTQARMASVLPRQSQDGPPILYIACQRWTCT